MGSISSKSEIKQRATSYFEKNLDFNQIDKFQVKSINELLKEEYELIPDKERIGKGRVYLIKIIAKTLYQLIKSKFPKMNSDETQGHEFLINILKLIKNCNNINDKNISIFAIHLTSNLVLDYFDDAISLVENWIDNEDWEIRENSVYPILSGLKTNREKTIEFLRKWIKSENPNFRRFVAESLRPRAEIKWLRDPTQNDEILKILTELNHDNSIYVRKSVGNNLKDLSKYMPEKILTLIEEWLNEKEKLNEKEQKNLIWTIYQALRWLKDKNPKYHKWIEKLVGKNYLLYFDEKRNRNAIPRK
ncbi:MAG: DNA alkylation repair protein [Candidatus Helarchaeota archaeon]